MNEAEYEKLVTRLAKQEQDRDPNRHITERDLADYEMSMLLGRRSRRGKHDEVYPVSEPKTIAVNTVAIIQDEQRFEVLRWREDRKCDIVIKVDLQSDCRGCGCAFRTSTEVEFEALVDSCPDCWQPGRRFGRSAKTVLIMSNEHRGVVFEDGELSEDDGEYAE